MANRAGSEVRRNVAEADLNADQHADHRAHRAGAEKRRQQRERKSAPGHQPQRMAGKRRAVGNPVADAGGHDDADQRRDEGHKRQNGFQHRINGVAPGSNSTATTEPMPIPTFASRPSLCSVIFLLVS